MGGRAWAAGVGWASSMDGLRLQGCVEGCSRAARGGGFRSAPSGLTRTGRPASASGVAEV